MRELTNKEKILEFMRSFGRKARAESHVYFTGGTTAVLMGWRESTIDIDLRFDPELDELFRAIPLLKEQLQINVELAAPSDFIPQLPGWRDRSLYIGREGKVSFFHYDLYSQALAKIERSHDQDLRDVVAMFRDNLVDRQKLLELFHKIESDLYKYPAIDPSTFAEAVHETITN
jgi:hypothetical protein